MADVVKLSSPETNEFWEIPVLLNDDHLLALNKPAGLLVLPDPRDPARPSLMQLLHRGIERGAPWARQLRLDFLTNAHKLDFAASGVLLLAKNKAALAAVNTQFGTEKPRRYYLALVRGSAPSDEFEIDAKLAPHPLQMDVIRVDPKEGKRSHTIFKVRERFDRYVLLECGPSPDRPHQIPAHLKHLRLPLVGDSMYGGGPLLLSTLKSNYRLKPDQVEHPLIGRPALHAERLIFDHPTTAETVTLTAPWPKDLTASIKYLRRFANGTAAL